MKALVAAVALVGITSGASTSAVADQAPDSGNALLEACRTLIRSADKGGDTDSLLEAYETGQCLGFVTGVRSAAVYAEFPKEAKSCVPTAVTDGQLVRVVVRFLESNPKTLHLNKGMLTLVAMHDAYPCE